MVRCLVRPHPVFLIDTRGWMLDTVSHRVVFLVDSRETYISTDDVFKLNQN